MPSSGLKAFAAEVAEVLGMTDELAIEECFLPV
jgi:hypothetical protein